MQNISYQCVTEQLKITIENHYSMILDDDVLLYQLMNLIVRYFILQFIYRIFVIFLTPIIITNLFSEKSVGA